MNHNVLNPCLLNSDYLSNSIPRTIRNKKSKKKKRKSKYKHFANKYKFSKKNNSSNFSGSKNYINYKFFKTSTAQNSWKAMSEWYWSNYKKAIEWQDKHKIAHWKACALALQEENRCLLQIINCLKPKFSIDLPVTMQDLNKDVDAFAKSNMKNCDNVKQENCSSNQEDFEEEYEFEISEEMMQFFETSFKHKLNLEKMKEEKQLTEVENSVKKIQSSRIKRIQEMQLLYGEAASMIIGMETAVQLSFDKFCDTKSPKFWPNIPLRL